MSTRDDCIDVVRGGSKLHALGSKITCREPSWGDGGRTRLRWSLCGTTSKHAPLQFEVTTYRGLPHEVDCKICRRMLGLRKRRGTIEFAQACCASCGDDDPAATRFFTERTHVDFCVACLQKALVLRDEHLQGADAPARPLVLEE